MNERMYYIILMGSLVSLTGTMIGASLGVFVKNPSNKFLGAIMGFAGGIMLSVVVFELIPEAITKWNFTAAIACCILGIVFMAIVDIKLNTNNMDKQVKVAFMAAIALMLHNLPEGIIMGCGFAVGSTLGLEMSLIIAIHDIPEGIAVSAPLMASRVRISKILFYAFITAVPTAIGTCIGVYIANISFNILGACLSLASGIMLYVVCGEMFPESSRLWGGVTSTIGVLSGLIIGLIMVKLL